MRGVTVHPEAASAGGAYVFVRLRMYQLAHIFVQVRLYQRAHSIVRVSLNPLSHIFVRVRLYQLARIFVRLRLCQLARTCLCCCCSLSLTTALTFFASQWHPSSCGRLWRGVRASNALSGSRNRLPNGFSARGASLAVSGSNSRTLYTCSKQHSIGVSL